MEYGFDFAADGADALAQIAAGDTDCNLTVPNDYWVLPKLLTLKRSANGDAHTNTPYWGVALACCEPGTFFGR